MAFRHETHVHGAVYGVQETSGEARAKMLHTLGIILFESGTVKPAAEA